MMLILLEHMNHSFAGQKIASKFDHIFYRGLRNTGGAVLTDGASDHYPLWAGFTRLTSLSDSLSDLPDDLEVKDATEEEILKTGDKDLVEMLSLE
jgi:hypothetical protein